MARTRFCELESYCVSSASLTAELGPLRSNKLILWLQPFEPSVGRIVKYVIGYVTPSLTVRFFDAR